MKVGRMPNKRNGSTMDFAYEAIKAAILNGQYSAGARLTEEDLAKTLEISRTPVREALHLLESELLVETVPRVGLVVPAISMVDLEEIFEVRWLIDGYTARLAAKRISKGELATLEALQKRIVEAAANKDSAAMGRTNLLFHRKILEATQNRRLIAFSKSIADIIQLAIQQTTLDGAESRIIAEHSRILEALLAEDPDAAEAAARAHVEAGLEFHRRYLAETTPHNA